MRAHFLLCLLVLSPISMLAADTPLNLKQGLWEYTVTRSGGGFPGMSPDMLAQLPPDQRARIETMMKQKGISMNGNSVVAKHCVTKEKIEKGQAFTTNNNEEGCDHTSVSSSPTHFAVKFHCDKVGKNDSGTIVDGSTTVDMVDADNAKGSTHISTTSKDKDKGQSMNMDMTFTAKYLGASCGDIK